jgi:DNA-directed RNA polymerase specialized sigma24 family protein
MLKPRLVSPNISGHVRSHEDLFVDRYRLLLSWALGLTNGQRASAEDLLHDLFIQFTLNQPDLDRIENLEGYLRTMLRNLHLSRLRRASVTQSFTFSFTDYDSVAIGLRAIDSQAESQVQYDRIQVQDELRRICHYACVRKETSKTGSVLILRFFHGYYPSEISLMLRTPGRAVRNWLMLARREARAYIEGPQRLSFMKDQGEDELSQTSYKQKTSDLVPELRESIFRSRQGACLKSKRIREMYHAANAPAIDSSIMAHIVSCSLCLDEVNKTLGLPPLSSRYPTDTLGPDKSSDGGSGGGPTDAGSGGGEFVKLSRRRRNEVVEHRPQELRVMVNGFQLGSQKVSSEVSELTLSVNVDEPVGFVEVISEQGLRLALLTVEAPPGGLAEHRTRVALSDDRTLELSLHFGSTWPNLHLLYQDPTFTEESAAPVIDADQSLHSSIEKETSSLRQNDTVSPNDFSDDIWRDKVSKGWGLVWQPLHKLRNVRFWSLPSTVTAVFAVVLVAALLFAWLHRGPTTKPSAAELLHQSTIAEEANSARVDQVLHRTLNLEERSSTGQLIGRHKIEVWQSATRGVTARRLYDERGSLVAGDWRRADGVQTLYHHGSNPRLQIRNPQSAIRNFDDVWQLEPSAKEFTRLIGNTQSARLEQLSSSYVISYTSGSGSGLIKATLVISRDDLRAVEQILRIAIGGEEREYRFTEASFERHSLDTVAPSVFDAEPELLSSAKTEAPNSKPAPTNPAPDVRSATPVLATAELEVEVLRLLSQAGADLGEQINVTRTSVGLLRVDGLVESERRKDEILRVLSSLKSNTAVVVQIQTVDEALKKAPQDRSATTSAPVEWSNSGDRIPVDSDLRRYFSGRGFTGEALEQQIRSFATRVVNRSQQVQAHAYALRSLVNRFSVQDLQAMDPDAKRKWRSMICAHAEALSRDTAALHRELEGLFPPVSVNGDVPEKIRNDAQLVTAVGRLFALTSANNQNIQSVFTISPSNAQGSGPKSAQFWQTLISVESLAAQIAQVSD